jgi:Tfp pilus assembly protein PilO
MIQFRDKQQIAICAAAVAMVCGFVLLRYLPLQRRMKYIRQVQAAQMLALSKASAESGQIPIIREELLQLQTAVGNFERQIPAQRELGEFLQKIANLMNENNLREQVIQPGKEINAGELNCIPVNMQCKGKLSQIFEFYRRVQGLDRLVRIEHVKLTNDGDFSGEVTMQTEVVIYYSPRSEAGRSQVGQG